MARRSRGPMPGYDTPKRTTYVRQGIALRGHRDTTDLEYTRRSMANSSLSRNHTNKEASF